MADGAICRNTVALVLATRDEEHLLKLGAFLGSSNKLIRIRGDVGTFPSKEGTVRFALRSARLVADLARFGVTPNKTKNATAMILETDRHFWRGVGRWCMNTGSGDKTRGGA
jgi:hypothetical protein